MKKQRKEKDTTTPPSHEEKEYFETMNLLPPYIPPRRTYVPQVTIPSKGSTTLVAPKIPKGMIVLHDIMPQLQNLSFEDPDTRKIRDLNRKNNMKLVKDMPYSLN